MDKEKNPIAQAMARMRWAGVSDEAKREHAMKMVAARGKRKGRFTRRRVKQVS